MLKNMSLHGRLMGSFLLMGGIVMVVGFFGWRGTHQLSSHIDTLSHNSLPSIDGLWRVNEGQTQIQSAERAILNPELPSAAKQSELNRMQAAWKQIDAGLEEYEATPRTPDEDKLYQTFKQQWQAWKQDHAAYLQAYQDFARLGVVNPTARQLELTSQKRENSPEMKVAIAAEIRKLADQSKKSTEKISTLVGDIQSAISSTVVVTHEGTKTVEEGTRIAQETSESFAGVEGAVNNIVINSQQISLNINQQAIAIQQIVSAMNDLNIAARETASGISQIRSGTQQLNESAQALKATI